MRLRDAPHPFALVCTVQAERAAATWKPIQAAAAEVGGA
jgi:hypothetical protein